MFLRQRVTMVFSLIIIFVLLVGCTQPATPTVAPAESEQQPSEQQPTAQSEAAQSEPVDITWHSVVINDADIELVNEKASEYLQSRGINANLKLMNHHWSDFGEKVSLMLNSGEECDLVFTASWTPNNFFDMSSKGAYTDLDELLPKYAPELWASLTPEQWDAGRGIAGGGPITGVPNVAGWGEGRGIMVRVDFLEKYPFPPIDDPSHVVTFDQWEPYLEMLKENETSIEAVIQSGSYGHVATDWGYDFVINASEGAVVKFDDPDRKVVNLVEMPEFMEYAKQIRSWVDKGLYSTEALETEQTIAKWAQGNFAAAIAYWVPGEDGMSKTYSANVPLRGAWTSPQYLVEWRATSSLTSVCATSKNPEVAVQVLNLANTDEEFFNLISWGVEGTHWNWVDKEKKIIGYPEGVNASNVGYLHQHWTLATVFNSYYFDEHLANIKGYELIRNDNKTQPASVLLGFVFDKTPVETEVAQCGAIWNEYYVPVATGRVEDTEAAVAELQNQMDACGIDKIIEEAQKQIDAWAASK